MNSVRHVANRAFGTVVATTLCLFLLCGHSEASDSSQETTALVNITCVADLIHFIGLDPSTSYVYDGLRRIRLYQPAPIPFMTDSPVISLQPFPASLSTGESVILNVATDSRSNSRYQWRKNGIIIPGATNSHLNLEDVGPEASGWYLVTVTNADTAGLSVSDIVKVSVGDSGSTPPAGTGTALLRWTAPFERTDGTPLQPGEITGYRIYQGSESRGWFKNHYLADGAQTTLWLETLPPDLHYFSITAVDSSGQESEPTAVAYKRIDPEPAAGDS